MKRCFIPHIGLWLPLGFALLQILLQGDVAQAQVLTLDVVAEHDSENDCWYDTFLIFDSLLAHPNFYSSPSILPLLI